MLIFFFFFYRDFLACEFISDPPTTTAQRLKGLTTGSLPTFIDISRNFASSNISEDNWVDQAVRAGKRVAFLGDDTWASLFPGRFHHLHAYPSFNVRDTETVDNGVLSHLWSFLDGSRTDWDILVGHFLGVDHVGHTYGPSGKEMEKKMEQMDVVLKRLWESCEKMGTDTLCIVMGDHGMTDDGNHGGASPEETSATLLAFSKSSQMGKKRKPESVPQIDLVPTLSVLLGLPIPFANVGSVIPQMFPDASMYDMALLENVKQVRRYVHTYTEAIAPSEFIASADLSSLDVLKGREFLKRAAELCRQVWATFDVASMVLGIVAMTLTVWLAWLHVSPVLDTVLLGIAVGSIVGVACAMWLEARMGYWKAFLAGASIGSLLLHMPSVNDRRRRWRYSLAWDWSIVLVAIQGASLFSNSFIEAERGVNYFFLVTMVLYAFFSDRSWGKWLAFLLSVVVPSMLPSHFWMLPFACAWLVYQTGSNIWVPAVFVHFAVRTYIPGVFETSHFFRNDIPRAVLGFACVWGWLKRDSFAWHILFILINGPVNAVWVACYLFQQNILTATPNPNAIFFSFLKVLSARWFFYASGHLSSFSTINFESGFMGIDEANLAVSGVLIVLHTIGGFLVPCFSMSSVGIVTVHALLTSVFVCSARRHLMVWRVFAPKYIFDTCIMLIVWLRFVVGKSLGQFPAANQGTLEYFR